MLDDAIEAAGEGGPAPAEQVVREALTAVWARLLDRTGIGDDDNFFRLGGDSLLAVRLLFGVRRALGVELSLQDLVETPELGAQIRLLTARYPIEVQ